MIDLSRANIKRIANQTGFLKDNVEKVMRLADVLETIFSSKWKDKLVLKGGTAINMFYRNLPRLSVDIDLDYTGGTREEMLEDKARIKEYLQGVMFQKNYAFSDASKSYFALDSLVFQYTNNAENRDLIKVEINYLDRAHIFPVRKKRLSVLGYNSYTEVNVLDECELYGNKLAAMIDRAKPRDVYDVYGMIKSEEHIDPVLLRKCLVFYNCVGGNADILDFKEEKLTALSRRDFDRMLKPMLSKSERFNPDEAITVIKEYLKELLCFTAGEIDFVDAFKSRKYYPDLLFGENDYELNVSWHPMAYWKCGLIDDESVKRQTEWLELSRRLDAARKEENAYEKYLAERSQREEIAAASVKKNDGKSDGGNSK